MSVRGSDSSSASSSPRIQSKSLLGPGGQIPPSSRTFISSTNGSNSSDSETRSISHMSHGSLGSSLSGGSNSNSNSPSLPQSLLGSKDSSPASFTRNIHTHLLPTHLSPYSPPVGSSPGVGVRRLAEKFLDSICDDSPAVRPRRIGLGKHTTIVQPTVHVPTQTEELDKFASQRGQSLPRDEPAGEGDGERKSARVDPIGIEKKLPDTQTLKPPPVTVPVTTSAPSLLHPNTPSVSQALDDFDQLHNDIQAFANACAEDTQSQKRLREELVQRTQWSIRCVWPTAQVDLVGSVAAGVCLPKSDLDFVVWFLPGKDPPPSYSYATTPNTQQGQGTVANYTYTTAASPPVVEMHDGTSPPSIASPTSPGGVVVQHFAHASSLIKLIGGRKKSKLLFRSTKIQVFKDINLIRLRDGCSGISMDLWFPVDPAMLTRSQQHTMLIQKMQADFPLSFYSLAIVLKSFMSQNLLNCLEASTPIQMADGSVKKADSVQPGDELVGHDGAPVTVEDVSSKQASALWRISQESGSSYLVTPEHRLTVRCNTNPSVRFESEQRVVLQYVSSGGIMRTKIWRVGLSGGFSEEMRELQIERSLETEEEDSEDSEQDSQTPTSDLMDQVLCGTYEQVLSQVQSYFSSLPRSTYLLRDKLTEITPVRLAKDWRSLYMDHPTACKVTGVLVSKHGASSLTPNRILSCSPIHAPAQSPFTVVNIAIKAMRESQRRYALADGTITHNSGYSGLGSYGVLLMLIRFLQYERFNASKEQRPEETNLGKLLVGFFRLYATFDYIHHAIDVVNLGPDGDFLAKPPVIIVKRVKRPNAGGGGGKKVGGRGNRKRGDESDEDDEGHTHHQEHETEDENEPEEERESASLKKKRSNAADRFTLLILDPMDAQNQIICHHKALRNMIGAFIRAIMILDPDNPAPALMLPPIPTLDATQPALTATGPGVQLSEDGSQSGSAPNTPPLVPQPIQSLPPFPGLTATASNTNTTRFHRLIEVNTARLGPQTKPCPSAQCTNMDGSSKTMCPIQNKVCFTCGHLFVKPLGTGLDTRPGSQGGSAGSSANSTPHKVGMKGHSPSHQSLGAPANMSRHGHAAGVIHHHQQSQHRSPPMQGQHQRNYINQQQRSPHAQSMQAMQQQQQPQQHQNQHQQQQQQQQHLYNAQTMLAAQQLLAAQLSSQNAAAAAVANASSSPSPIMFYNLNTNQMEPFQSAMTLGAPQAGLSGAPLGFIPVMAYAPAYTGPTDPQSQQMATMTALMQQMQVANQQVQQQAAQQQAQAQAAQAAAQQQQQQLFNAQQYLPPSAFSGMYAQPQSGGDLSAYLQPTYVPPLSYDYSPTYTTRTISDPQLVMQQQQQQHNPPSPPTHLRSTSGNRGGGVNHVNGKLPSSRANQNFNHQALMQQAAQAQAAAQQQQQQQQLYNAQQTLLAAQLPQQSHQSHSMPSNPYGHTQYQ